MEVLTTALDTLTSTDGSLKAAATELARLCVPRAEYERVRETLKWITKTCRQEIPLEYTGRMREILLRNLAEAGEKALAPERPEHD
jgi:hypothetical protein